MTILSDTRHHAFICTPHSGRYRFRRAGGECGGGGAAAVAAQEVELQQTMAHIAELALLGAGDSAKMFPATVDEWLAVASDEHEFRVAL